MRVDPYEWAFASGRFGNRIKKDDQWDNKSNRIQERSIILFLQAWKQIGRNATRKSQVQEPEPAHTKPLFFTKPPGLCKYFPKIKFTVLSIHNPNLVLSQQACKIYTPFNVAGGLLVYHTHPILFRLFVTSGRNLRQRVSDGAPISVIKWR